MKPPMTAQMRRRISITLLVSERKQTHKRDHLSVASVMITLAEVHLSLPVCHRLHRLPPPRRRGHFRAAWSACVCRSTRWTTGEASLRASEACSDLLNPHRAMAPANVDAVVSVVQAVRSPPLAPPATAVLPELSGNLKTNTTSEERHDFKCEDCFVAAALDLEAE